MGGLIGRTWYGAGLCGVVVAWQRIPGGPLMVLVEMGDGLGGFGVWMKADSVG